MILKELLEPLIIKACRLDHPSLPVTGLAYHSEKVSPGDLFVCIKGYKNDGHSFLASAVKKGARAAVVERFQEAIDVPQYLVEDSRQALAVLADKFYGHPSRKTKTIGVTASNGKTTTTFMINAILEEHSLNTGLIGTVIVKIGNTVRPAVLTTPESLDLHQLFRQMVEQNVTHVTMETSSSGLELHRVGNVDFDIAMVSNISREHIDLHGSFEAYFDAKARLVREAKKDAWAVFNLDCPHSSSLLEQTRAQTLSYGLKNSSADCLIKDLDLQTGRARFNVALGQKFLERLPANTPAIFPIKLSVLGLHSVYNAMAAVMAGLLCEVPVPAIQKALSKFRGVERRFELIFEDDIKIIDDHFANRGNIDVTLETLKFMDYRKLHLVYAIRGSRGVTVNRESAEALTSWAPELDLGKIIATTSCSHVTEKDKVRDDELAVFQEVMKKADLATDLRRELPDAIARGLAGLKPGDILLLAGCQGMDHGARICLEQIHSSRPHLKKEEVFHALKDRVAGM